MNSRLRTILFLVSITAIFAFVLLMEVVATAKATDVPDHQISTPTSEINSNASIPGVVNAVSNTLTISIDGGATGGSGNVRLDGVDYSGPTQYVSGTIVTLSAIPDLGSEFVNWSGGLNSTLTPDDITMDNSYQVTAHFKKSCYSLTLGYSGEGSSPTASPTNSTGCPINKYFAGESIDLTPFPAAHWQVGSWSGTENGASNTVIMPASNHSASVTYTPICYPLTVTWNHEAGNVQYTNANCPGSSSGDEYLEGTVVGLEAFDAPGYVFTGWAGSITGSTNPTTVTMNGVRTVTANFSLSCHSLTTTHTPPGTGSNPVASPTKSASCPNPDEYVFGEEIDLSAQPNEGWRVESWSDTDNDNSTSNNNTLSFPALANGVGHVVGVNYKQMPTLQFKQASYQVNETGIMVTIEVERVGSLTESVDVWYSTSDGGGATGAKEGEDYVATSGRLTFGEDVVKQSFEVEIIDDVKSEGTEIINLTLSDVSSNAVLGAPDTAELLILDDEGNPTIQFQTTTYSAQEISPTLPVTITLFPIGTEPIFVDFRTQPGTATGGVDYTDIPPTILRFNPGETEIRVDIPLIDDTLDEPNETVFLELSNNDGADLGESQAIMTILDDDDPPSLQFSSSEYYVKEGEISTPVTVTMSAASSFTVTVDFDVIELSVGLQLAGTLIFEPGEQYKAIDVPVSEYQEGDTLNIFLSEAENATLASPSSASLTILDKDRSDCHPLTMQNTGYGKLPITTNLKHSIACPEGHFVANELIFVLAEPDPGWRVDGWFGTLDNDLTTLENIVRMPDSPHLVNVYYLTSSFLPSIPKKYVTYFEGPDEAEPNDTLSTSNGPIRSNQDYFGGFASTNDIFDNFFFHLEEKGSVQIQLSDIPVGRDYNLLLLSSSFEIEGYSGTLTNTDEHISVSNLDPGLYYVSVHFFDGPVSPAKYRLNVIYD